MEENKQTVEETVEQEAAAECKTADVKTEKNIHYMAIPS